MHFSQTSSISDQEISFTRVHKTIPALFLGIALLLVGCSLIFLLVHQLSTTEEAGRLYIYLGIIGLAFLLFGGLLAFGAFKDRNRVDNVSLKPDGYTRNGKTKAYDENWGLFIANDGMDFYLYLDPREEATLIFDLTDRETIQSIIEMLGLQKAESYEADGHKLSVYNRSGKALDYSGIFHSKSVDEQGVIDVQYKNMTGVNSHLRISPKDGLAQYVTLEGKKRQFRLDEVEKFGYAMSVRDVDRNITDVIVGRIVPITESVMHRPEVFFIMAGSHGGNHVSRLAILQECSVITKFLNTTLNLPREEAAS